MMSSVLCVLVFSLSSNVSHLLSRSGLDNTFLAYIHFASRLYLTGAFIIQKLGKGSTGGWLLDILSSIFLALLAFRPWLGHDSLDENKIYIELTGVSQFFSHQNHILNSDEIFYSH
ncbi:hypothetical protein V2G26_006206 [Clonostachys chloroleuca]